MKNHIQINAGLLASAGILAVGLIASVWNLWRGPILVALVLALALLSPRVSAIGFKSLPLLAGSSGLLLFSLTNYRDIDHLYGLAVFLMLGYIGGILGLHSTPDFIVLGVMVFLAFLVLFTCWLIVANPEEAFNQTSYYFGALTGPFAHRNNLGGFLAFGMAPLIFLHTKSSWLEIARWTLFGISSILLIASQSLTPVVALCIAALVVHRNSQVPRFFSRLRFKRPIPKGLLLSCGGGLVFALSFALLPWLTQLRPTLGSRLAIWDLVIRELLDQFPSPPGAQWISSGEVVAELGFNPVSAHNALLSLFLVYGILPTLFFVTTLFMALNVRPSVSERFSENAVSKLGALNGLVAFMLAHSAGESFILAGPVGALMVGTFIGLMLRTRQRKLS